MLGFIRFSRACRVQKLPRVSCYKILPLTFPPSQNGPGGALCGVLASGNIVCRLCAGTRHRGRKSGRCGACVPPGFFVWAMQPPTTKTSQPGGRLTRAGPGHSRQRVTVRGCGLARCRVMKPAGHLLQLYTFLARQSAAYKIYNSRRAENPGKPTV